MTAIIIPRRHYTQPQGRLAAAAEWSDGLVSAFSGGSGADVFGRAIVPVNDPTIMPGGSGLGVRTNGSASCAFIAIPQTTFFDATLLCLSEPSALITNRGTIQVASSVSTNPIISIRTGNSNASRVRRWVRSNSGGSLNNSSDSTITGFAIGKESLIGIRLRVEAGSPNPIHSIWVDGVADDNQTGTISPGYTCDRIGIGALVFKDGRFDFFNGRTYWGALFTRALDDDEMRALAANPWQLFRADPVRIYSFPTGPIIPVLSGLTTTAITQSGARHSLTLTF